MPRPLVGLALSSLVLIACGDSGSGSGDVVDAAPQRDAPPEVDATPSLPPGPIEPVPYLGQADSPFAPLGLENYFFEDFEDGVLDQLGVTADSTTLSSSFGPSLIDSVDGDDGDPTDGVCAPDCEALFGNGSVTFTFDAEALGGLPTHVGIVWTDGSGTVAFEAFDGDGASLGATTPAAIPDADFFGGTAEDHFLGVVAPGGVSSVRISNSSGGTEVDHLQYGF